MTKEEILALREKLGLTQEAFAKLLGVARVSTISRWENGFNTPDRRFMERLLALVHELWPGDCEDTP